MMIIRTVPAAERKKYSVLLRSSTLSRVIRGTRSQAVTIQTRAMSSQPTAVGQMDFFAGAMMRPAYPASLNVSIEK